MGKIMKYVGLGLGLIIIVATFLPWATVSFLGEKMTVKGTEGDGFISLVAAVLYIAMVFMAEKKMLYKILGAIFSLIAAIIGFVDLGQMKNIGGGMGELGAMMENMVQLGIGIYLVLIAGILGIIVIFLIKGEEPPVATQTT